MRGKLCYLWFAAAVLTSAVGCPAVQVNGPAEEAARQRGKVVLPAGAEQDVYYPAPFASPPNLLTETTFSDCSVVEQKPDHFRIRNPNPFSREVTWEARGVPVAASGPVQVNVAIPPAGTTKSGTPATDFANTSAKR